MDLNFTAKQFDKIVAILTAWMIDESIDYEECEKRIQAIKLDQEIIDWLMETVNIVNIKDIEKTLTEAIEEETAWFNDYQGISNYEEEGIF